MIKELNDISLDDVYKNIFNSFLGIDDSIKDSIESFFEEFPYWGKLERKKGIYEELYLRAKALKKHVDDYKILYNSLMDYRSKKVLYSILSNYYRFDFVSLSTSIERNYEHYFDLDILNNLNNEVFVDLGSYTGDTILSYLNNYGLSSFKKIYGYEPTKKNYDICCNTFKNYKNIIMRNKAVADKNCELSIKYNPISSSANTVGEDGCEKIDTVSIDNENIGLITMVKMDIEGFEKKALAGLKNTIKKYHPKLLISVYHNHEDLYEIPKLILELDDSYKFYLRYYGNNIFPTEIVLIAI